MIDFPYFFSALSIMFGSYEFARRYAERACARANELRILERVLPVHYDALEQIFEDPAPSESMRKFLLFVSEAISDRDKAKFICDGLADENRSPAGGLNKEDALINEINSFVVSRPDLVIAFNQALKTGIFSLVYRWPENACRAEQILSSLLSEKKQELMTVYRFAQDKSDNLAAQAA